MTSRQTLFQTGKGNGYGFCGASCSFLGVALFTFEPFRVRVFCFSASAGRHAFGVILHASEPLVL